ncbi:4Fe-4S dicluster domain-containing protein [Desulfolutivibrio sulfoxidireducens]|uniref:NADH-quinone oxidoreductase subunit B family protein n=1 Tax=Desulfolutivibrio sulfoxidireducens TaxID=2773299 RepID=UPI00159D09B9|nr:4Fe-4S dicluster domain-containing protein [Desulfolutivibrio sulfoxidireducens]QLA17579.1 4Fe-4S dicluster domain-containing protein [Desulfolutivibrio sulfoxidireducens]QLA21157.1 4Fe-4S dicluster domain-containing protein [Desulfolutivibrio sulfoxidireducens]
MLRAALERLRQKRRTVAFPAAPPSLPDRFRGLPVIDAAKCRPECRKDPACAAACPVGAIRPGLGVAGTPAIDLGKCLFCTDCMAACPTGALTFGRDYRLAVRQREHLLVRGEALRLAEALERRTRRLFGRSLKLRQVSAGGCNACEADLNVLTTIVFDLGRFGIEFVASPRHADGLMITGPVTENMREALLKCHDATPDPKIVIASGSCAISGGPFAGMPESHDGADALLPVDLYIPGCPPHPITALDGMLRLLGRI